jgi:Ca-activated chloride channel homolog
MWNRKLRYWLLLPLCVESALLLMFACVLPCAAQSELAPEVRTSSSARDVPTINSRVQEVNVVLSVTGHHGRVIPDLTAADISILDNDHPPERVTYFESDANLPLRIALVVDISDSVTYAFDLEKSALADFVKHDLRVSDLALIVGFNEQPQILLEPTSDYQQFKRAIRGVHKGGETALYDAVAVAAQELGKINDVTPARHAIIVISDGEDNASKMSLEDAAEAAQENAATVYVLKVGEFISPEVENAMKQLCALTGGQMMGTLTESGIPFSRIEQDLRSQYLIGYIPANTNPDGTFHRVSIRTARKLKLHYPQGYFAR